MARTYDITRVHIVILDDSDDETSSIIDDEVKQYRNAGFLINVIRRRSKDGAKAGALQNALEETIEEYVAIFDADFIPKCDFLLQTVPIMHHDPGIAIVQTRWDHINHDYNFVTRAISLGIDGHFFIDQSSRFSSGWFLNFNGSGGLLRVKALVDAGGWHDDTLAEDLDVSYRIQLQGYKIHYLRDYSVPGEIPPTISSFKRQQGRWACGSLQVARKMIPSLMRKRTGRMIKLEGLLHLTYYLVHPLIVASFLLASLSAILNLDVIGLPQPDLVLAEGSTVQAISNLLVGSVLQYPILVLFGSIIVVSWSAAWMFYIATLRLRGENIRGNLRNLIMIGFIGYGISISNTIQASKVILKRKYPFMRTPKYAVRVSSDDWKNKSYHVPLDVTIVAETAAIILGTVGIIVALSNSNFGIIPILSLYVTAYGLVTGLTLFSSKGDAPRTHKQDISVFKTSTIENLGKLKKVFKNKKITDKLS